MMLSITIPVDHPQPSASPVVETLKERLTKKEPLTKEQQLAREEKSRKLRTEQLNLVAARAKRDLERAQAAKRRAVHARAARKTALEADLDAKEQSALANRSRSSEERLAFAEKRQAFAQKVAQRREAKEEAQKVAKALLLNSLESADHRRNAIQESIKQAAEREVCKASEVKQALLEKRAALAAAEKKATFEKLQAAEARRATLLLARAHLGKPLDTPPVIEVDFPRGEARPSASLLERLSARPCFLAATSDGRRESAAARRAIHHSFVADKTKPAKRAADAAARRAAASALAHDKLQQLADRVAAAKAVRAAKLVVASSVVTYEGDKRARAVAAKRGALERGLAESGEETVRRLACAASRRDAALAARAAKGAKMGAAPAAGAAAAAVELAIVAVSEGGVVIKISAK